MKVQNYLMAAATTMLLCSFVPDNKPGKLNAGIKKENRDETVKPGDDFFKFANGGWMKNNPLTPEYSRFGSFDKLAELNNEQMRELVENLAAQESAQGSIAQKVGDVYKMVTDSVRRNKDGYNPIKEDLKTIASIKTKKELFLTLAANAPKGLSGFFGAYFGADMKDSKKNLLDIGQGGLTLGQKDYYVEDDEATTKIRNKYKEYIVALLKLAGYKEAQASVKMEDVMRIETRLAKASLSPVQMRDPMAIYHKMTMTEFKQKYNKLDWDGYFTALGIKVDELNVSTPDFFVELETLFQEESLPALKNYVEWRLVNGAATVLSDKFGDCNFDFFGKTLSGRQQQQPRWKRGVQMVNGVLGEAVGQMYVEKYFSAAAKERMVQLVKNLQVALGQRIDAQEWMSAETKQKAHDKLDAFYVKVGYPDKWKDYSSLNINPALSLYENLKRVSEWQWKDMLDSKMNKPVDPTEWGMTPQTVNAYYNPTTNEICFPAGILQYPFFDMSADDAFNYGAIGVVIGHEMTHGFDDEGSQFDKDGNFSMWWTPEDRKKFDERTQVMDDFFSAIEVLPGLNANGRLTLGENLADHGGLEVSFRAFKNATEGQEQNEVDGLTPDQRFFVAYASVWAQNIREEEIRRRTKSDPHSLGEWRVNGALPHIDAWYEAFGVKEGDAMYLPKEKRVSVW